MKFLKYLLKSTIGQLVCLITIISLLTWAYISYTQRDIHLKYNGIKYQRDNLTIAEPITIEIEGKFLKGVKAFNQLDEFEGTIKVGGKVISDKPIKPNQDGLALLNYDSKYSSTGQIHISGVFDEFTIGLLKPTKNDDTWNNWFISFPAKNRKEAVELTNKLIAKTFKGGIIIK